MTEEHSKKEQLFEYRAILHNVKSGAKKEVSDWYKTEIEANETGELCVSLYNASHHTIESRPRTEASNWYDNSHTDQVELEVTFEKSIQDALLAYEKKANIYASENGISEYRVEENMMTYEVYAEDQGDCLTYLVTLNLETMDKFRFRTN